MLLCFSMQKKMPVSLSSTACLATFVCVYAPLFHPLSSLYACFCGLLPHTAFAASSLWVCISVFMCVCDELAGNWLLNGATAAMWDKIETRETERPIHLLSANHPRKTTVPFIKPPLTTCRTARMHTHTHTERHTQTQTHTQFYSRVSLSTCHFLETFYVKICNTAKFKFFSKFSGFHRPAKQSYFIVGWLYPWSFLFALKTFHFADKLIFEHVLALSQPCLCPFDSCQEILDFWLAARAERLIVFILKSYLKECNF